MSKNTEINFIGQPIFKQIVNLTNAVNIESLVRKHNSDYYYKAFKSRTHLITMLFGILSRCDSMTEICEGMRALGGKLNHLGLKSAPAKSTACDELRNRYNRFFEDLYFSLVKKYQSFLSDSRTFGLTFKEVLLIVFDRAYNNYNQFALWSTQQVFFVTRLKKDALYTVMELNRRGYRKKGQAKVLRDEIIELEYNPVDDTGKKQTKVTKHLRLRKVCYQDEQNRYYEFLTNSFDITAEEVAFLYKKRWGIELLFYVKQKIMQSGIIRYTHNQFVMKRITIFFYIKIQLFHVTK